jgi:UDP-glucose:(heptosyl)LPS alpha-1,3-glucosyltransferase
MMARNLVTDLSGPRYAIEICKQLAELGNEVFIPTSNLKVKVSKARILKLPRALGARAIAPVAYTCAGRIIKARYGIDVIHGNGYSLRDDVTTVHYQTAAFVKRSEQFIGKASMLSDSFHIAAEKVVLRSSRHLIAVSESVKKDLKDLYNIPEKRITVVHNGVTLDEFSPPGNYERVRLLRKYGFGEDKVVLLFGGGSAYERKGFRFLVDALPYISSNVVVVAICRNLSQEFVLLLSKSDAGRRVVIEQYVPRISEIYKAVDIFILPTIYDPFPLAVLEAMASQLPVIVSSLTGAVDIVRTGENGIILRNLHDARELADAVNALACDEKLRRQMGLNARKTAEQLSWRHVTKQVLKVYEAIAKA